MTVLLNKKTAFGYVMRLSGFFICVLALFYCYKTSFISASYSIVK